MRSCDTSNTILPARKLNTGRWGHCPMSHSYTVESGPESCAMLLVSYPINQCVFIHRKMLVERTHTLPSEGSSTPSPLSHPSGIYELPSLGPSVCLTSVILAAACLPPCPAGTTRVSDAHIVLSPPVGMFCGRNQCSQESEVWHFSARI